MTDLEEKLAERSFEHRADLIKEIGMTAFKFLLTLNSGAFVLLLGFLGNASKDAAFSIDLARMQCALLFFLFAIFLLFGAMLVPYLSAQRALFGKSLPGGKSLLGHTLWMVVPPVLSFLAFGTGSILAIYGINMP